MIAFLIASDQLLTGFTVGVTIWHFFIQAPLLVKLMGKEKFVPLMMQLTRLWIKSIFISSTLVLALSSILFVSPSFSSLSTMKFYLPVVGWLAVAINHFGIVPKALKAGARSHHTRKGDNNKDIKDFAVDGGGKSETAALHQTVVVFVVVMLGGFLPHMVDLSAASLAAGQ
jgi:hypothetical protein